MVELHYCLFSRSFKEVWLFERNDTNV